MKLSSLRDRKKVRMHAIRRWKRLRRMLLPPQDSLPAFVFGQQRSGTGMLMYMLEMHDMTELYDEASDSPVFREYRIRSFEAVDAALARSCARVVCLKPICDSHVIRRFLERYPEGKHLWIHRHYLDAANSAIRRFENSDRALRIVCTGGTGGGWFQEGISDEMLRRLKEVYRPHLSLFECACLVWWARNRIVLEEDLAREENVYLLRYEDLVTRVEEETRELFRFLGLPFQRSVTAQVHAQSIRRHDYPPVDPAVADLCEKLTESLDRARERNRGRHREAARVPT